MQNTEIGLAFMANGSQNFVFPPPLKHGGTIGLVSPVRWASPQRLDELRAMWEGLGYNVEVHAQNYLRQGVLAGSPQARAEAITDMFMDRTIDAILCVSGGVACADLHEFLDYKQFKDCAKPFIGSGGMTFLLHSIAKHCGFITYYGPMARSLAEGDEKNTADLLSVVGEREEKVVRFFYPDVSVVRPGQVEGTLLGGNVAMLQYMIGTPCELPAKDTILFIEEKGRLTWKLHHDLKHMKMAGKFKDIRAILVGQTTNAVEFEENLYGTDVQQMILDIVPSDIPICFNFPCGYIERMTTLPVGGYVHLSLDSRGADLSFVCSGGLK